MRTLAMLAVATLCLDFASSAAFAQGQSGPQPGLPPGAGIMAPNAGSPPPTGRTTTVTQAAPMAMAPMDAPPPVRHRRYVSHHHYVRHHHYVHHVRHPVAPAPAPAAQ